ncbi:hypothetical protein RhiirA4_483353 [Rhizophagus irregularis]|uniref:Uncharacterized protein n=1 Tax=Rhizophagus irregularis TaxID=588596 RepID=A0A2I1HMM3_9GLOM|nr:hypothetical protein RhiirA4_483353 [Rhizophagus irregularis]
MNKNAINNHFTKFKVLKCNNLSLGNSLKLKRQEQKQIFKDINKDIEDVNLDQIISGIGKLEENSEHVYNMMVNQNDIVQNTFILTEEILISLKTSSEDMKILSIRLNNTEGIGGWDVWKKISRAFDSKIDKERVDFRQSDMEHIKRLEEIINEVDISIEEFECLMRLRNKSNHKFHKGSQTMDEAKNQLKSFPENIVEIGPLKKVLKALEIWDS